MTERKDDYYQPWLRDAASAPVEPRAVASDAPPEGAAPVSRQVCSCLNVRENAIAACLQNQNGNEDQRLAVLQGHLRCGTQCGSCVPELRRLVRATAPLATASI